MNWLRDTSHIGLELTEREIRMAQVKKTRQGYELAHAAIIPLPEGDKDNGLIARLIREAVAGAKLPSRVVTAVPGSEVLLRPLLLPAMPDEELEEAVRHEAEAWLSGFQGDKIISFIKTANLVNDGVNMQELLVVAARRDGVDKLTGLMGEAGLETVAMDVQPLALARCALLAGRDYWGQRGRVETFAVVKTGIATTLVTVIHHDTVRFARVIPYGSLAARKVVVEVGRSLDFCMAELGLEVARVYLAGSGANPKGLGQVMVRELDVEIVDFNPLKLLAAGTSLPEEKGSAMAVAMGLALKEVN
ncbi:MAG: pilus assembly protein PilM [Clostridia bacterium]|nr:pilus assembly protein PilM [Clostridia bacterium]